MTSPIRQPAQVQVESILRVARLATTHDPPHRVEHVNDSQRLTSPTDGKAVACATGERRSSEKKETFPLIRETGQTSFCISRKRYTPFPMRENLHSW